MEQCTKCERFHTGICGIPAGVTLGFRVRVGGASGVKQSQFLVKTKPKSVKKGIGILKKLLEEARIQEKNVVQMINIIPPELPEYNELLNRLSKLEILILQLNRQIIVREHN